MVELVELYARHAERFDRARTRSRMELPYLENATALAPPPGRVLDLGCGSGEPLARYFVEKGYRVTGVDPVHEMLEMCRARFPGMTWLQSDMRQLELAEPFEIVIAWDSFFHLRPDDQREMFATFQPPHHSARRARLHERTDGRRGRRRRSLRRRALPREPRYARVRNSCSTATATTSCCTGSRIRTVEGHTVWIAQRRSAELSRAKNLVAAVSVSELGGGWFPVRRGPSLGCRDT